MYSEGVLLMGILLSIFGACSQGVIWAVMVMGVYITYRVLNYADLTADGAVSLGASVSAISIFSGLNPILSILLSTIAGMCAGAITGVLNTKLKIPAILSGILTMISLYSINIRIMGKANISLLGKKTIFSYLEDIFISDEASVTFSLFMQNLYVFLIGLFFCVTLIIFIYWFFGTEIGSAIRATGDNECMIRALGVNTDFMKILGLMIGNGLIGLSGALICQNQGYADINMGTGAIVIGLASIIIGETIIKGENKSFSTKLISVVLGSVIYRIIIAIVLQLGMSSSDLKLLTAGIVAFALSIPNLKGVKLFNLSRKAI